MKLYLQKITSWVKAHKKLSVVILVILIGAGYGSIKAFSNGSESTRYVLAAVERGNIIASVSGSGQVSTSNQLDVKPRVSGETTSINVKAGQEVKAGTILAQIDSQDALQDVRDAQADLTSAKISLEKTKTSTAQSKEDVQESLTKAYEDGYNTLTETFTSYSNIIDDVDDIFYDRTHSPYIEQEYLRREISYSAVEEKNKTGVQFDKIKSEYESLFKEYEKLSRSSSSEEIEKLIDKSYAFSKQLTDVLKGVQTLFAYLEKRLGSIPSELTEDKSAVNGYISTVNGKVSGLFTLQGSIKNAKADLTTANQTYSQISGSTDPLDVQTAQLTVTQRQNAYQKTLSILSDYTIRAPFDGVVASVSVNKGDSVSSATSILTLMTKQQIATISLNEIDAAEIEVGQKATLTFDAIEDLTITGKVSEIDLVGTVSQGVVNYKVKIVFDTENEKVKPGMTVNANIITDMKQDVLMVPSSAVRTQGNINYVEVVEQGSLQDQANATAGISLATSPRRTEVVTGFSNDESVEIISGLEEGQQYVSRTITTGTTATQTAPSLFGGGTGGARTTGGGGFGGGGGNFPR